MSHSDFLRLTDVDWRKSFESEYGLFIAEGAKVISRAFALGYIPREVLTTEKWLETLDKDLLAMASVTVIDESAMEEVTGYHVHRGALVSFERPQPLSMNDIVSKANSIAVLEGLVDHENVGAIFRSAAALGIDAILITDECADPLYRRSIKTSMGASLTLPYARIPSVATLASHREEFSIAGLVVGGDSYLSTETFSSGKQMFVFGSEGTGLSDEAKIFLNQEISIPMARNIDSLNVAQCAAIVFWCYSQRVNR